MLPTNLSTCEHYTFTLDLPKRKGKKIEEVDEETEISSLWSKKPKWPLITIKQVLH